MYRQAGVGFVQPPSAAGVSKIMVAALLATLGAAAPAEAFEAGSRWVDGARAIRVATAPFAPAGTAKPDAVPSRRAWTRNCDDKGCQLRGLIRNEDDAGAVAIDLSVSLAPSGSIREVRFRLPGYKSGQALSFALGKFKTPAGRSATQYAEGYPRTETVSDCDTVGCTLVLPGGRLPDGPDVGAGLQANDYMRFIYSQGEDRYDASILLRPLKEGYREALAQLRGSRVARTAAGAENSAHVQAESLHDRMQRAQKLINDRVSVRLNQQQFDALVSLAVSTPQAFDTSPGNRFLKALNAGSFTEAADLMLQWNKTPDPETGRLRDDPVLTARRAAERHLFLTGDYGPKR